MKISRLLLIVGMAVILLTTAFAPSPVPSKPILISPINKLVVSDPYGVLLKWRASTTSSKYAITSYDVEVSDSPQISNTGGTFVTTVDSAAVTAPTVSYTVDGATLEYGRTYYWHVRASDSMPSSSAWSSVASFRVGVQPPTPVDFIAPPDADPNLLTLRPTFQWEPSPQGATSYTIQVTYGNDSFSTYIEKTIRFTNPPSYSYALNDSLLPNREYFWRMRANNTNLGNSTWSDISSFTSANPPAVPELVSPKNIFVTTTPLLTWGWKFGDLPVPVGEDFSTFRVEIFTTNKNVDTLIPYYTADLEDDPALGNFLTTTFTVPKSANLIGATTYYWRIKAFNNHDLQGELDEYSTSILASFKTTLTGSIDSSTIQPSETLGNVPGLLGPGVESQKTIIGYSGLVSETANLLSLYPLFTWNPGALNVKTFTFQVASYVSGSCDLANPQASTFASAIIDLTVPYTQTSYTADLSQYPNSVLCWRIRGNNPLYGSSDWSDVQIFMTANPPSIPVLTSPNNATLNNSAPLLDWNDSALPSGTFFGKYEVEISSVSNFKGYTYAGNQIPPYLNPIPYPLNQPILPGSQVNQPVYTTTSLPDFSSDTCSQFFPQVDQAHDPFAETANDLTDSWYQVEQTLDLEPLGHPLCSGSSYFWRVRAYNDQGEYSAWSAPRSFKTSIAVPQGLQVSDCRGNVLLEPAVSATLRPCFKWNSVANAASYQLVVATTNNFDPATYIINQSLPNLTQYQPASDLPRSTTLYWRVIAVSSNGYGSSAPALGVSFTTPNPPDAPLLREPATGALITNQNITFKWHKVAFPLDPVIGFGYYELEISEYADFSTLSFTDRTALGNSDALDITLDPALFAVAPARLYYWHVRACNNADPAQCSTWSTSNSFRTSITKPTLILPINTSTLRPTFSWNKVDGANNYRIYISRYSNCTSPAVYNNAVAALTFQPKSNLFKGVTYYWCVQANSKNFGSSPWSDIASFKLP